MSKVHVRQPHHLDPEEARSRVRGVEADLARFGVKLVWSGAQAKVKGTGVSGSIVASPTAVEVTLKLGLVARAAGIDPQRLERGLSRKLAEALAPKG